MRTVPGVLVDRVNIGGNETGQQSNFASKGTRPQDAVLDARRRRGHRHGRDRLVADLLQLRQLRGDPGLDRGPATSSSGPAASGLNFVVKRGTNLFRGSVRGYFDNEAMESSNVPDELAATGVTHETSDHNKQISDYGVELGGPIVRDKAWFYGVVFGPGRAPGAARRRADRPHAAQEPEREGELAGDARRTCISFLYFDGFKIKDDRSPGISGHHCSTRRPRPSTRTTPTPTPAARAVEDRRRPRRRRRTCSCRRQYAYYNTGFILDPMAAWGCRRAATS